MRGIGLFVLLLAAIAPPAWGHAGSTAFVFADVEDEAVRTRLDVAARDLDELLALDRDGDGHVTWVEVQGAREGVVDYVRSHFLVVARSGAACDATIDPSPLQAIEHADGWYVVVRLEDRCSGAPAALEWSGVFDVDASHRALVRLRSGGDVRAAVLSPSNRRLELGAGSADGTRLATAVRYFKEGLVHVLTGLDHLLFLAGLFLPVALERVRGGWVAVSSRRVALARAAVVVTAFTIAHACTVCLVALGALHLPSRLVESLVALSVAVAGFNNLVPLVPNRRLALLAGGFGLIHGAAIGGALLELGLPPGTRALALATFNIGVECAQLLPVTIAVVVTFAFRESVAYRRAVLVPGSAIVTACGLVWLAWRALALPAWAG